MFVSPKKITEQSFVDVNMKIADVGCGTGHHTFDLAEAVGPSGRVYAIDVQEDLLMTLKRESDRRKLNNVIIILADAEKNTGIESNSLDRVFFSNSFFQFEDKEGAVMEAKRLLRRGGRIVVVDWLSSFNHLGPHPDNVFGKEAAVKLFLKNDFQLDKELTAVGDYHYGLIFKHD
ncbi:MAG: class I SAM-dependent methyltransferase [bacterium]